MTQSETTSPTIPVGAEVLQEAEILSTDILWDIEMSLVPLSVVVLKALRLARILNDFDMMQVFEWESAGYPKGPSGVKPEIWTIGEGAGRTFFKEEGSSEIAESYMYLESIESMEHRIAIGRASLQAAHDPDVAISSRNQFQTVSPVRNATERKGIRRNMQQAIERLASRRTLVYNYAARKHYEIKFSGLADDVFGRIRSSVDASIGSAVPDAVKKFTAVHDNLRTDNPENWSNAVHSCRRVLQDLADVVFPAQDETRTRTVNGKEREIGLKAEQYINRLMAFIEDSSQSSRFREIVGSHLDYIGNRLDALFRSAQKGSHSSVTKEEADRCVVYTYLIVGDILSLRAPQALPEQFKMRHLDDTESLEEVRDQIGESTPEGLGKLAAVYPENAT